MRKIISIFLILILCMSCLCITAFADTTEPVPTTEDTTTDTTEDDDDYASGVLGWFQRLFDGISELPEKIADAFRDVVSPIIDTLADIRIRFQSMYDVTSIGIHAINALRLVFVQVGLAVMMMPTELQTFAMFSVLLMVGLAIFRIFG